MVSAMLRNFEENKFAILKKKQNKNQLIQLELYEIDNSNVKPLVLFLMIQPEGGWIHQILLCLNVLEFRETIKSASSAVVIIIQTVRILSGL